MTVMIINNCYHQHFCSAWYMPGMDGSECCTCDNSFSPQQPNELFADEETRLQRLVTAQGHLAPGKW